MNFRITTIFNGFYPRLHQTGMEATEFFPSYIQTYIERDVRSLKAIADLNAFSRFTGLCAGRIGQILNLSSLANDTGISVNTAKSWLSLLESGFIVFLLPPYYKNFNKRLVKSPKIYFFDTGLACSLLKLTQWEMIQTHYLYGALYENFVMAEIMKVRHHAGKMPSVYYWRESNGIEIDCILEQSHQKTIVIEIKGGQTFNPDYIKNLKRFPGDADKTEKYLVYPGELSTKISEVNLIGQDNLNSFLDQVKKM